MILNMILNSFTTFLNFWHIKFNYPETHYTDSKQNFAIHQVDAAYDAFATSELHDLFTLTFDFMTYVLSCIT